jgi:hypothetical protein
MRRPLDLLSPGEAGRPRLGAHGDDTLSGEACRVDPRLVLLQLKELVKLGG